MTTNDMLGAWERKWLIWSHERGMWWKPHKTGYTYYKQEAGLYTYPAACAICEEANKHTDDIPCETMVDASTIDATLIDSDEV